MAHAIVDGPEGVEVRMVVITRLATVGRGIAGDPVRRLVPVWSLEGELLFAVDTLEGTSEVEGGEGG